MKSNELPPGIYKDEHWRLPCIDPGHNPPGHIYIEPGSYLIHQCPSCGKRTTVRPTCVFC